MVVDLSRKVRVVLLRRFEHHLGAIGELVRGKVDLAKAAFADESAEGVIADCRKVGRGELVQESLV